MKKTLSILLALVLMLIFALPVFAAGADDGILAVTEKNGKKYLGEVTDANFIKYEAADGSGLVLYDLNDDGDMNVCDLVALKLYKTDINGDSVSDGADAFIIRWSIVSAVF